MSTMLKIFLTLFFGALLLIPGLGEVLALPVLAMIGGVWLIKPAS
jgi:hypothetical protein